jgi:RNA ligase
MELNLNDFRAKIAHKTEIRESNRGTYTVFDYVVALKDTFDSYEAREARGIAFDNTTGKVISRPYAKFHNFNECDGWRAEDIDLSQPHDILEKLDGSMIRTIEDDSPLGFHFGTRAGVTDVSKQAWDYFVHGMTEELKGNYIRYIQHKVKDGFTVIFEYVAPTNQIVISYDRPQLILTAVRSNSMGIYQMYTFMVEDAKTYGIPVVQRVASEHSSIVDLADHVKDFIGAEGVVVRFADGHMVKMKGLDYVQKHKALDGLRWEKDVLVLIFNGQLDDVLPLVTDDVRSRLEQYRDDVLSNVKKFDAEIRAVADQLKAQYGDDRKAYREEAMKHKRSDILMALLGPKQLPKHGNWVPFDLYVYIVGNKYNISCLRTQETVDEIRDIIGPNTWYEYGAKINTGDA